MSRDLLGDLWTASNTPGPERGVLLLSQSQARALLDLIKADTKPDDEVDEQRHRHLTPDALCEWCGELDLIGNHENGCRLGTGPDELFECPKCNRAAAWTDGALAADGDAEVDEFWCQTCGAEVPLSQCRQVTP